MTATTQARPSVRPPKAWIQLARWLPTAPSARSRHPSSISGAGATGETFLFVTRRCRLANQAIAGRSNASFAKGHAQNATKPEVLSECCSCTSQRDDRDLGAQCIGQQNSPGIIPTVMGSLGVWTLMDCKCSDLPLSSSTSEEAGAQTLASPRGSRSTPGRTFLATSDSTISLATLSLTPTGTARTGSKVLGRPNPADQRCPSRRSRASSSSRPPQAQPRIS